MRDVDAELRAWLVAKSAISALFAGRVYASLHPPPGYKPADGPAVTFNPRGGKPDYSGAILRYSYQFLSYGATEALARQGGMALYDAMHDQGCGPSYRIECEQLPQLLQEPETEWFFSLGFYTVYARA